MKIWFCICILFFIYNLLILMDERYEVTYATFMDKNDPIDHLGCISLKERIFPNKPEFDLDELNKDLLIFFNKLYFFQFGLKKELLDAILHRKYLIYNNYFCFIYVGTYPSRFLISDYVEKFSNHKYLKFNKNKFVFFKTKYFFTSANQLKVINKEYPYSKCRDKNYSNFKCLNNCFKENGNRLSKYFYDGNETGTIYLNYDQNKSILEQETNCFDRCKDDDDCELVYMFMRSGIDKIEKIIKAFASISKSNYFFQMIGLICLIFNFSFCDLIFRLVKFFLIYFLIISKKENFERFKKHSMFFKIVILIIILTFLIYYYTVMILEFNKKKNYPFKKETVINLFKPEVISLVFCMIVNNILTNNYEIHFKADSKFGNKTFSQLEEMTEHAFNENVDQIYLEHLNKKIKINWKLKPKVFFIYGFTGYSTDLSRCFQVEIYPNEPNYQVLLSTSKIVTKLKKNHSFFNHLVNVYILSKKEEFTAKSYRFKIFNNFVKKIIKSSKSNKLDKCIDYEKRYPNCTSRSNCIEKCINRNSLDLYQNITLSYTGQVIDKSDFTDKEWSNSYAVESIHESNPINELVKECETKYAYKECLEVIFEDSIRTYPKLDSNNIKIDLYYEIVTSLEEEPSIYKLILDILNVQTILFGYNIFKILMIFYLFIKIKLKHDKILLLVIYLLCTIGFMYHIYHIFNEIINGELVYSQHYEVSNSIQMPEIVFCFDYNFSLIDPNYKLTGNYIEHITNDMQKEFIFSKIVYLNKSSEWVTLKSPNLTNFEFGIRTFYFQNTKCFVLDYEIEYKKNQFFFSDNNQILKIFFNKNLYYPVKKKFHFMTRKKHTMQFSKIVPLDYRISIYQEIFSIIYKDKFELIKNPFSIFYGENNQNDIDKYLTKLLRNYKETFHLLTLNLPLKQKYSNYEIDDELFEQYFNQIQNLTDCNTSSTSNYQRSFFINFMALRDYRKFHENEDKVDSDFEFNLVFFKKIIKITNEDNYAKLILNLLNVSSIWFNLGVLDLYFFISKIKIVLLLFYQNLLTFKNSIKFIDPL